MSDIGIRFRELLKINKTDNVVWAMYLVYGDRFFRKLSFDQILTAFLSDPSDEIKGKIIVELAERQLRLKQLVYIYVSVPDGPLRRFAFSKVMLYGEPMTFRNAIKAYAQMPAGTKLQKSFRELVISKAAGMKQLLEAAEMIQPGDSSGDLFEKIEKVLRSLDRCFLLLEQVKGDSRLRQVIVSKAARLAVTGEQKRRLRRILTQDEAAVIFGK